MVFLLTKNQNTKILDEEDIKFVLKDFPIGQKNINLFRNMYLFQFRAVAISENPGGGGHVVMWWE